MTHFVRYAVIGAVVAGASVYTFAQDDLDALLGDLVLDDIAEETTLEDDIIAQDDSAAIDEIVEEAMDEVVADIEEPVDEDVVAEVEEPVAEDVVAEVEEPAVEDVVADVEDVVEDLTQKQK